MTNPSAYVDIRQLNSQLHQLLSLVHSSSLQNSGTPVAMSASRTYTATPTWVLDSGANDHMTGDTNIAQGTSNDQNVHSNIGEATACPNSLTNMCGLLDLNEDVHPEVSGSSDLDSFSFQELINKAKENMKRSRKKKKNTRSEIILKNMEIEHKWGNILRNFNPLICDMIKDLAEVTLDGHCGYRSIATMLGYTDDLAWWTVRGLMLEELMQYAYYYTELYGNNGFENHKRNLECTKSSTMNEKEWLDLLDMGSLVASAFNSVFVTIVPQQLGVTYFPLRKGPEEMFWIIAIFQINKGHFVPVVLKDIAPLPPVWRDWQSVRWPEAVVWETILKGKLGKWAGSVPINMQNLQYVYPD